MRQRDDQQAAEQAAVSMGGAAIFATLLIDAVNTVGLPNFLTMCSERGIYALLTGSPAAIATQAAWKSAVLKAAPAALVTGVGIAGVTYGTMRFFQYIASDNANAQNNVQNNVPGQG